MSDTWARVSPRHPCPVCRKPDWCTIGTTAVCCMRVQSQRPARNGGWLHVLDGAQPRLCRPQPPRPAPAPALDFAGMIAGWLKSTPVGHAEALCAHLGVSGLAMYRLVVAWAPPHAAWAFPMRDEKGSIIGIRLRAEDGRKWAVRGSRAGLIYDPMDNGRGTVLVCEGPTDTAAALTHGYRAVGRPSCRGQAEMLRKLLCRWRADRGDTVIVADNDEAHWRPTGDAWRPGLEGALDLARELRFPCRVIVPPVKDLREWSRQPEFELALRAQVDNAAWRNVR